MRIVTEAHAKINWALNITGLRANGYHELEMLMQEIALSDTLTFESADDLSLTVNGALAECPEDNLIIKAARALNRRMGTRHGASIALTKRIPARAGLGGGSADCGATLRALNRLWDLNLSDAALLELGATLGADVPFCLTGGLARVSGIGEVISPFDRAASIPLTMVTPGGGLSTVEVFHRWDAGGWPKIELDVPALVNALTIRDLRAADALCRNALTAPAIAMMPEIADAIGHFRALGARCVFMTGSGSTVVAAFDDEASAQCAAEACAGAIVTHTVS